MRFDRKLYKRLPAGVWALIDRWNRRIAARIQAKERKKARARELVLAQQRIRAGRETERVVRFERRMK